MLVVSWRDVSNQLVLDARTCKTTDAKRDRRQRLDAVKGVSSRLSEKFMAGEIVFYTDNTERRLDSFRGGANILAATATQSKAPKIYVSEDSVINAFEEVGMNVSIAYMTETISGKDALSRCDLQGASPYIGKPRKPGLKSR